ncbi:hypothetical protein DL766_007822 [Monosporascus sp. MC13-8B]|uniref:DUF6594 domain-containing protein n=1 Tax=Monosporascus cannonballus TaxID=155416 RepID=A0ABY0GYA9_9PEZI|nr:hypothetical protein DL762_007751 [Monosporascus cannonballus]RYO90072.1 hypothetical protein DL763_005439 [Monosporascus cannonballus]RYP21927.1 hypothetical protein DL766_007822 [Monosporascus sp. MC13-8B]
MAETFGVAEAFRLTASTIHIFDVLRGAFDDLGIVRKRNPRSHIVLNFRTVQRERIYGLQREILDKVDSIKDAMKPKPDMVSGSRLQSMNDELDQLLHKYGKPQDQKDGTTSGVAEVRSANALRDYETFSQEPIANPEHKGKRMLGIFPVFGPLRTIIQIISEPSERHPIDCHFRELNREIRLEKEREEAFLNRLMMGTFGGLALIIPMLIMALLPGLKTSLITSSVATVLFASGVAEYADNAAGKDVLAAVAAYAAVLVVFVGASMAPIS